MPGGFDPVLRPRYADGAGLGEAENQGPVPSGFGINIFPPHIQVLAIAGGPMGRGPPGPSPPKCFLIAEPALGWTKGPDAFGFPTVCPVNSG